MARKSWKQEFDSKYRKIMNSGDSELITRANKVVLSGIAKLDKIIKGTVLESKKRKRKK